MKILKMGMVGGGPGAFIGEVHRKAARMDGGIVLAAGAFDIDPKNSRQMGRELGLDKSRVYDNFEDMVAGESALPPEERIDFVTIATPNNWHYPIAKVFIEAGFDVMCEKPMTLTLEEAEKLRDLVRKKRCVFGLMHNYTGYPMVKLARDMVKEGDLGKIQKIVVQYPQGWLVRPIERDGVKQASWRTDPKQTGAGGCVGDIGTHAANLAEYVSGLTIRELAADITTFVKGRKVDDDVNVLLRLTKGAKGVLHSSQISIGEENNLAIWVHGTEGSIEWHQEHPNYLYVRKENAPEQVWKRGNEYVGAKSAAAARCTRLPAGHPEAFIEAFANNYVNFADAIRAKQEKRAATELEKDFPQVTEGVRGLKLIDAVVRSSKQNAEWVKL